MGGGKTKKTAPKYPQGNEKKSRRQKKEHTQGKKNSFSLVSHPTDKVAERASVRSFLFFSPAEERGKKI